MRGGGAVITPRQRRMKENQPLTQLGYAYVLTYYDNRARGYVAHFQLWYKTLNVTEIYERKIKSRIILLEK